MPRRALALTFALFFASGVSGLVYQVVWVRRLGHAFGNTLYSAALVTSVFMCGLGLGSWLAGRWIDRRSAADGLRFYGWSELAIGGLGLLLAFCLPRLTTLSAGIASYEQGAGGWYALSIGTYALHYAAAIVLLGPPCLLMGGTLTLLIRFVVGGEIPSAGWRIGVLYGLNTAGAALGALLTDFALVPALGIAATQLVAVALNLLAGAGALLLARRASTESPVSSLQSSAGDRRLETEDSRRLLALSAAALFLSGAAAMGLEILWFRYLSQVLGSLRVVFSLLLAVMLAALWLGSTASGLLQRRFGRPELLFAISQALLVVSGVVLLGLVDHNAGHQARLAALQQQTLEPGWGAELASNLRVIVGVTALPSLFMGFAFPLANACVQRAGTVGARAGVLYLGNTLGNVLGASVTGFALIPFVGVRTTAWLLLGCAGASILPMYYAPRKERAAGVALASDYVFAACTVVVVLAVGVFGLLRRPLLARCIPSSDAGTRSVVTLSEGPYETIAVLDVPGLGRTLYTNGHPMSSTTPEGQRYMRAFVHVPLLQLDAPERVLVICFGVGNTLHAASLHPVEHIEVADLSRHVLGHASYFRAANEDVLRDPRVRVFVNDGRHHLLMQPPGSYDLITLEPPPIAFAGVSALYSREFYELARSRLSARGYLTQWLPGYQLPEDAVRAMVRAFVDVFPESVLLSGDDRELILVGTTGDVRLDLPSFERRLRERPAVGRDLDRVLLGTPLEVAGMFAGNYQRMRAAANVPPVTDDRPVMEYSQRSYLRQNRLPADLFDVGAIDSWCADCRRRIPSLERYLAVRRFIYASEAFLVSTRTGDASAPLPDDAATRAALDESAYLRRLFGGAGYDAKEAGRQHLAADRIELARGALERSVFLDPTDPEAFELLGHACVAAGQIQLAREAYQHAIAGYRAGNGARGTEAHYELGLVLHQLGDKAGAEAELAEVLALAPDHPRANAVMCKRAAKGDRRDEARRRCAIARAAGIELSRELEAYLEDGER